MSTQVTKFVDILNQTPASQIVELEPVKDKFIKLNTQILKNDVKTAESIYHKEVFNFKKQLAEKPELRECSQLSLYGVFLDLTVNQFSLEAKRKPDVYVMTRNYKTGRVDNNGKDIYEKRAYLQPSPYGELMRRIRAGQIRHADPVVIVFKGDTFEVTSDNNGKHISYKKNPEASTEIIASFIRIVRPDGSVTMNDFYKNNWEAWKQSSAKNNGRYDKQTKRWIMGEPNALYTSNNGQIDLGFLEAKTILHALNTFPDVKIAGQFTLPAKSETFAEPVEVIENIDYGISTEDINHEEVHQDDFSAAVNQTAQQPETVRHDQTNFNDEPDFD